MFHSASIKPSRECARQAAHTAADTVTMPASSMTR